MKCSRTMVFLLIFLLFAIFLIPRKKISENHSFHWTSPEKIDPLQTGIEKILFRDMKRYIRMGQAAFKKRDFSNAARFFLYVLQHNSSSRSLIFQLAECYGYLRQPETAAAFLVKAVNSGFDDFAKIRKSAAFQRNRSNETFRKAWTAVLNFGRKQGRKIYVKVCRLEECTVHLPKNFDPLRSYHLLIGMHGNGGDMNNFSEIWSKMGSHDVIFVVPRGPYAKPVNDFSFSKHYSWAFQPDNPLLWKKADYLVIESILEIKKEICRRYRIRDTYLLGFSQGASFAYSTAIKFHSEFRGVISFAGILPDTNTSYALFSDSDLRDASTLRVFISHGRQDGTLNFNHSMTARDRLKQFGFPVKFTPFPGSHEIPASVFRQAIDWMHCPQQKIKK